MRKKGECTLHITVCKISVFEIQMNEHKRAKDKKSFFLIKRVQDKENANKKGFILMEF